MLGPEEGTRHTPTQTEKHDLRVSLLTLTFPHYSDLKARKLTLENVLGIYSKKIVNVAYFIKSNTKSKLYHYFILH